MANLLIPPTQQRAMVQPESRPASPFGCCNYFDLCGDGDLLSLHYNGRLGLLDWLNFQVSEECYRTVEFITYVRPSRYQGNPTAGYLSNPCSDPNGTEFGTCKLTVEDFGLVGRAGPTRKLWQPKRYCITSPRIALDGRPIADESEWDMVFAMDTLLQDMRHLVINGNAGVAGQFDGLQNWVDDDYTCKALRSYVVNWNGNDFDGGAGATVNGAPIPATAGLIDVLLELFRKIRERIGWSPVLDAQQLQLGNMILVLPQFMVNCILNAYTCWSLCTESYWSTPESRTFREKLNGGLFGAGRIFLDGIEIPLLVHDWGNILGPSRGDMYFLTGAIGGQRIFNGEFLSATQIAQQLGGMGYFSTDGGRVLGLKSTENLCYKMKVWQSPRLFCRAPWAQIRFQNVRCTTLTGILSADPEDASFFPASFDPATCPA